MINLMINWKKIEVDFMDEKVTAEVRPLKSEQMLLLTSHLRKSYELDQERRQLFKEKVSKKRDKRLSELTTEMSENNLELQRLASPVYPLAIRNIEGVQVNGNPIKPSMLGDEAALCDLALSLLTSAVISTNLNKESEKNLQSQSAEKSQGQIADQ